MWYGIAGCIQIDIVATFVPSGFEFREHVRVKFSLLARELGESVGNDATVADDWLRGR